MAASVESDEESFQLESSVRGHHVFKTPVVGQLLQVQLGIAYAIDSILPSSTSVTILNHQLDHFELKST